ncbi:unnamed protein product [Sphagnum balticum]
MWAQCCRGDYTLVTNALAREYCRAEVMQQCQGIDQSGDIEGGDSDDNSDGVESVGEEESMDEEVEVEAGTLGNPITLIPGDQMPKRSEDQDWQVVSRGKSRNSRNSRS